MNRKSLNPIISKNLKIYNIRHGFFTKNGGVSSKNNYSLNCSYNSNDIKNNVINNRKFVCKYHKLGIKNLKTVKQIHSNKIKIIKNIEEITSNYEADAIITRIPNIILGILTADCAPVLVFDAKKSLIAAIHIGWKGAINNILSKTIENIIDIGSNVKDINLAIGPCIGPESYEVREDFYKTFIKNNVNNKKFFKKIKLNKFKFNLPNYIFEEARELGVLSKNICVSNKDTFIDKNNFFSYRRNLNSNLDDCGRMISTISITAHKNDKKH
jgi:hypothetical protein